MGDYKLISIGIFIDLVGRPAVSFVEFIFSPIVVFIAIGVISILFPFYNIHKTLLEPNQQSGNQTLAIISRIFSLQMKERSVRDAPEWPVDINFLSRFLGLVFIPAIVRILVEIFNRFY